LAKETLAAMLPIEDDAAATRALERGPTQLQDAGGTAPAAQDGGVPSEWTINGMIDRTHRNTRMA